MIEGPNDEQGAKRVDKPEQPIEVTDYMIYRGASLVASWFGSSLVYARHEELAKAVIRAALEVEK